MKFASARHPLTLLAAYALVWIALAIAPTDRWTWFLENLLVLPFVAVLTLTWRRFAFSNASYVLIAIYLCVHAFGAHYSYRQTPLGDWLRAAFELRRNPFDRIGHCAFGLLLAYPLREIVGRLAGVRGALVYWLPIAALLALSSVFEVIEAVVAQIVSPGAGLAWLGAQGDEWDAQMDMAAALGGACAAMLIACLIERMTARTPAVTSSVNARPFSERHLLHALCAIYLVAWIVAAIDPVKRDDWLLENLLVFAFVGLLVATYRRLPLGDLSYVLLFLFLLLHAVGAHYTYSEVPPGYWAKETFGLSRNHFDRLVHFSFGLLLLQPAREVLMRVAGGRGFWSWCLPMTLVVSLSGLFEIVEAVVAWNVKPELGAAYLGTQGDVWDAQKDMALAVAGAALAVLLAQAASLLRRPASSVPRFR